MTLIQTKGRPWHKAKVDPGGGGPLVGGSGGETGYKARRRRPFRAVVTGEGNTTRRYASHRGHHSRQTDRQTEDGAARDAQTDRQTDRVERGTEWSERERGRKSSTSSPVGWRRTAPLQRRTQSPRRAHRQSYEHRQVHTQAHPRASLIRPSAAEHYENTATERQTQASLARARPSLSPSAAHSPSSGSPTALRPS